MNSILYLHPCLLSDYVVGHGMDTLEIIWASALFFLDAYFQVLYAGALGDGSLYSSEKSKISNFEDLICATVWIHILHVKVPHQQNFGVESRWTFISSLWRFVFRIAVIFCIRRFYTALVIIKGLKNQTLLLSYYSLISIFFLVPSVWL